MHEMHIIKDVFADVVKHAQENDATKVTKVYLTMGEFTEINEEILRFFFEEHSKGTSIEGAQVEIEKSPTRELRLVSFDCE
ncbi:MAG: hydrogenase maturation nickel metallochaperone HypA, partial [Candidatus Omnitrophica bacterium]|nr:hydrogenase maturation nickel metallochaperone HypA [Candidatus Omnitrophota bacterium]